MMAFEDMKEKTFNRMLWLLAVAFMLFCAFLFLSGCKIFDMTEAGAAKRIAKVEIKQPAVLYNYCSSKFDPVIREHYDTIIREGKVIIDSVTVDCDSVMKVPVVTKIVKVPCQPHKSDTVIVTKTIEKENKAKVSALTVERDKALLQASKQTQGRKIWMWIAIALMVYTVLRWVLKIWLKISLP